MRESRFVPDAEHEMKSMSDTVAPLMLGLSSLVRAQAPNAIPIDSAKRYVAEPHALCTADNGRLWGFSLCGPIMFVDPRSRAIVGQRERRERSPVPTHERSVQSEQPPAARRRLDACAETGVEHRSG